MTIQRLNRPNPDRPRLDEVPEEYRDTITDLFDTWAAVRLRNRTIRSYYEMHKDVKSLGISIPPQCEKVNAVVGWCAKAVDAIANRSIFDGFVTSDGETSATLDNLVRDNRLRSLYHMANKSALTYGLSAVTVMRSTEAASPVKLRVFSANQCAVLWDKNKERIAAGVVLTDADRSGLATEYVVHTSDAVITLTRGDAATQRPSKLGHYYWSCTVEPHPLGRPMMEIFVHDPDPDRPLGHSIITPEIMGIVDKAMRDVLRMEVGAEFFTAPQRYILGVTAEMLDPSLAPRETSSDFDDTDDEGTAPAQVSAAAKWRAYLGSLLAFSRDENGDLPQVGQFAAGNADNFTAVFENDAQRFSGATNVPLSQLGVLSNNYTSSDALDAANDPLVLSVEVSNARNREVLEELARMIQAVTDGVPLSELDDEQRNVQACFKNPSMPTISASADAWTKIGALDSSVVGTDVWYESLGIARPTITRLKAEKSRQSVTDLLKALATTPATGSATTAAAQPGNSTDEE